MNPIFIIGAPRSGTKMLRELLIKHPLLVASLHEQEKVWSYGQAGKVGNELSAKDLTPEAELYIKSFFDKQRKEHPGKRYIDKNVANTLRIGYIRAIFPHATFIHIIRDGRDAICSSKVRWSKSPLDWRYLLTSGVLKNSKLPIKDIPYFVKRQLKWIFRKVVSSEKSRNWWGPRFIDSEELLTRYSLTELCGIQWARCIDSASFELAKHDQTLCITVKYEDLVQNPVIEIGKIFNFLSLDFNQCLQEEVCEYTNQNSLSKWKGCFSESEYELLLSHIGDTLVCNGYKL